MKPEEVQQLYDESYAERYNQRFLMHPGLGEKTSAEREVLKKIIDRAGTGSRWLDLACGTGYFLSQFPHIDRAGLDLSAGMLSFARKNNPNVPLVQGDFRQRELFPEASFDVVSSMWWAYSYLDTFGEIEAFISNASHWLKDNGLFFLPIGDYTILARNWPTAPKELPYQLNPSLQIGGGIRITGLTWSYDDVGGQRHEHMLLPQPQEMVAMACRYFACAFEFSYTPYYRAVLASKVPIDQGFVSDIAAKYHHEAVVGRTTASNRETRRLRLRALFSRLLGSR